jgi:hypothetical protein
VLIVLDPDLAVDSAAVPALAAVHSAAHVTLGGI